MVRKGSAEEVAEKFLFAAEGSPQRLKPLSKQSTYRSAESTAPPKSNLDLSFPQPVKLCPSRHLSPQTYFPPDYVTSSSIGGHHEDLCTFVVVGRYVEPGRAERGRSDIQD
jgi:hypothetical protein